MNEDRPATLLSRIIRRALLWLFKSQGWKAVGAPPADRRCVIIAAPHTSNWDFLYFIGLTDALGIKAHFMAKKSLFRWPLGRFMRDMGGVEIDRSSSQGYVDAMIAEFNRRKHFMLTIAPEGTRGAVRKWRTGFYHIAHGAGVPLVLGMMDYGTKTGGLGPAIMTTGDYEADMAEVAKFYHGVTPKNPERTISDFGALTTQGRLMRTIETPAERYMLYALAHMCSQYLAGSNHGEDSEVMDHLCMSPGEAAYEVLEAYGLIRIRGRAATWTQAGLDLMDLPLSQLRFDA